MREQQGRAAADVGRDIGFPDRALKLIRREHHDRVGPGGGLGDAHPLEAFIGGLFGRSRSLTQSNGDLLHPRITEVERVGVTLGAVADNGDLLVDQAREVRVAIIVDAHD